MPGDLYSEWLGVPPGKRPPDHYTLLGLPTFSDDAPAIEQAARKRLARLDRYAIHPDPQKRDACHRLMNEVARARVVLASPTRKRAYDLQLADKLGVAPPAAALLEQDTAVELDAASESDTGAEAESYLQELAQAAREKSNAQPTRRRSTQSNWMLPAGIVAGVLLLAIGLWLASRPTRRQPVNVAIQNTPPTAPAPAPVLNNEPPPGPPSNSVSVETSRPTIPPVLSRATAPPATTSPIFTAHSGSAVEPRPAPAAPALSGLAAINASLDRLTDWTVENGIWSLVESGRIRGEGPSMMEFDPDLPPDATVSFRLCVVKGMRPRIYFDGPDIYVGNEGYSKKITVHGQAKDLSGDAVEYNNGDEIAVSVSFIGADRFEAHLNDNIVTGACQPHTKIHLRLSGGDSWSRGTSDFWDLHITEGPPVAKHPAERPRVPAAPAAPSGRRGLFD